MSSLVNLIHVTPKAEDLIVYMARVSNPPNQSNTMTGARLIRYLIDHKHMSPFEMVNMCLEINTTRSVSAQIIRHRSFTFQEFSQRYANTNALGSAKVPSLRRQDLKNRQHSTDDLDAEAKATFYRRIANLFADSEDLYQEMVSCGIAKESARDVLPMASPTRLYMNGTLRSWLHYVQLRVANGTQQEHQQIAFQVQMILKREFPLCFDAFFSQVPA
jgi:thymidylate synthase (FAD)